MLTRLTQTLLLASAVQLHPAALHVNADSILTTPHDRGARTYPDVRFDNQSKERVYVYVVAQNRWVMAGWVAGRDTRRLTLRGFDPCEYVRLVVVPASSVPTTSSAAERMERGIHTEEVPVWELTRTTWTFDGRQTIRDWSPPQHGPEACG